MSAFRIGVIQFPGANCERETHMALNRNGLEGIDIYWTQPESDLNLCDGFIIIGGFSYEDRGRAGLIAAQDPLMNALKKHADQGKPILGLCNGAQILVESGLVPGIPQIDQAIALTHNKRLHKGNVQGTGYYNAWCYIKPNATAQDGCFNRFPLEKPLHVPIAHAQGRFILSKTLRSTLASTGATFWQYCDQHGHVRDTFPFNPNGSVDNLAGISNLAGNVLALMPHPERTPNGDVIFASMRDYLEQKIVVTQPPTPTPKQEPTCKTLPYQPSKPSDILHIASQLTDDTALSMQNVFQSLGLAVSIKRYRHLEVIYTSNQPAGTLEALKKTGELYNTNKEYVITPHSSTNTYNFLVQAKDDIDGLVLQQTLQNYHAFEGIKRIKTGILWQLSAPEPLTEKARMICQDLIRHRHVESCYIC